MITSAQFKLRKHQQTDRRAAQPSRQKSGTPQGKVQQEVNIYRNGPRGENNSSPKITDVSQSCRVCLHCCFMLLPLYLSVRENKCTITPNLAVESVCGRYREEDLLYSSVAEENSPKTN